MRLEPARDVVRVEDRDLRGFREAVVAHQRDVRPGDRENGGASPRRCRYGAAGGWVIEVHHRMPGEERSEVLRHADRPHPRAAAAMRDAERLVQVEVAHVGADVARAAEPDLRVHVGAVHVHLAAVLVHDPADLPDRSLEDAVGGRVGDHERREGVAVGLGLRAQIVEVDVARARRSSTGTTCIPAITALAGLVPWADCGIRQVVRSLSPREWWNARMTSRPAYSPCEPALGCSETAAKPVISASWYSSWRKSSS